MTCRGHVRAAPRPEPQLGEPRTGHQKRESPNRTLSFLAPRLRRGTIRCAQTRKRTPVPSRALPMLTCQPVRIPDSLLHQKERLHRQVGPFFLISSSPRDSKGAGVNDMPGACQSRAPARAAARGVPYGSPKQTNPNHIFQVGDGFGFCFIFGQFPPASRKPENRKRRQGGSAVSSTLTRRNVCLILKKGL